MPLRSLNAPQAERCCSLSEQFLVSSQRGNSRVNRCFIADTVEEITVFMRLSRAKPVLDSLEWS